MSTETITSQLAIFETIDIRKFSLQTAIRISTSNTGELTVSVDSIVKIAKVLETYLSKDL